MKRKKVKLTKKQKALKVAEDIVTVALFVNPVGIVAAPVIDVIGKAFTSVEVTGAIANETGVKEKIKNKLGGK